MSHCGNGNMRTIRMLATVNDVTSGRGPLCGYGYPNQVRAIRAGINAPVVGAAGGAGARGGPGRAEDRWRARGGGNGGAAAPPSPVVARLDDVAVLAVLHILKSE
jgi:hypothetical protein